MECFAQVVFLLCAISGTIIAGLGLQAWKKQLEGTSQYEVARSILRAVYGVKEAVGAARNFFMNSGEYPQELQNRSNLSTEEQATGRRYAYEKRWERVFQARIELGANIVEGKILWGEKFEEKFQELFDLTSQLWVALQIYLDGFSEKPDPKEREERTANKEIAMARPNKEEDPFALELDRCLTEIEKVLKPHLGR